MMKKFVGRKVLAAVAVCLGLSFVGVGAALANPPIANVAVNVQLQQQTDHGIVDWGTREIIAEGSGVPSNRAMTATQGRLLARRAAIMDAQRNLLETVKGVQVSADSTMENLMVTSDMVRTQVSGTIKGARVISEGQNPDGSYTVKLSAPLYGVNGLAGAAMPSLAYQAAGMNNPYAGNATGGNMNTYGTKTPAYGQGQVQPINPTYGQNPAQPINPTYGQNPAQPLNPIYGQGSQTPMNPTYGQNTTGQTYPGVSQVTIPMPAPKPFPQVSNNMNAATRQQVQQANYSGVVIDASGMGLECTFSPVIYDTNGRAIYGVQNVDVNGAINDGMVEYTTNAYATGTRAGNNPLVVKAAMVGGGQNSANRVNVVVSPEDGDKILAANGQSGMLSRRAVVFVK